MSTSDLELLKWAHERIRGNVGFPKSAKPFPIYRGGELSAVVIYVPHTSHTVTIHMAAENAKWATPTVIRQILGLPFQSGCERLQAVCAKKNKRVRKLLDGVGFKLEGTMRKAGASGEDITMYSMLKQEWGESKWAA